MIQLDDMNKTLLMVGVLVGLSMGALAGVPGVQRYNLEPKTAKANAACGGIFR